MNKEIKSYLLKKLSELEERIGKDLLNIDYAYEDNSGFHIIEISPESIRRGNPDFMEWEFETYNGFFNNFSEAEEDILISEPSEFNNMSNLIYKSHGVK